jgi:hypothetical protein
LVGVWLKDVEFEFDEEKIRRHPDAGNVWAVILGKPKASASSRPRDEDFVRIGIARRLVEDIHDFCFNEIVERSIRLF